MNYSKLPHIPGVPDTLRDGREYEPGKGKVARCVNRIHAAPAGWCPTCDSEWDHSWVDNLEPVHQTAAELYAELEQAEAKLEELKAAEPRDVVRVVDARKARNLAREAIVNSGYQLPQKGKIN